MKKHAILASYLLLQICFSACATSDKKPIESTVKNDVKKEDTVRSNNAASEIATGWSDNDTYTVQIVSTDMSQAIDSAKTKILKDIIKVRYKIYGNYAKIEEIKEEFREPLKNGEVISQKQVEKGIEIFFRIKDRDLKKKFEQK